ncbi:MAG: peptidylprolyl isomerase [Bacteroidales bacterium]
MSPFRSILWSCLFLLPFAAFSQEDVLLTIDGQNVTRSEFERIYHKNSTIQTPVDNKGVLEYLDLFVNFKLKVIEAEHQGLDTLQSFRTELAGYRDQLAKSYLKDTSFDELLIREAYDRMHTDLNVSHILVRCGLDATPSDTVAAWNKAVQIRKRLMKGESFETVARASSEDANAKDNGGTLGWITAFSLPFYSFECAVYSMNVGDISNPVRTAVGYHIIKLNDKRPSPGEIKIAHIYKSVPPKSSPAVAEAARKAIFAIADSLKMGNDFATLAKHNSDDKNSGRQGGELAWFGTGRMIPEFENAAFSLKNNGDIGTPVQSPYGWHLIKRLDQRGLQSLAALRNQIKNQMNYSQRNLVSRAAWINKLKKEYGFSEQPGALDPFFSRIDSAYTAAPEKADAKLFAGLKSPVFTIGNKTYTQTDFAGFIQAKSRSRRGTAPAAFVKALYNDFTEESVLAYEKSMLEHKYPDFRYLMQEYHDGILLFDLTDRMVWSRAVKDTVGLKEFYQGNQSKYNWNERMAVTVYTCRDSASALTALKSLAKKPKKLSDVNWLAKKVCPTDTSYSCVKIEQANFEKGDNTLLDHSGWNTGMTNIMRSGEKFIIMEKTALLPPAPKTLQEARGLVTADYQDFLEKEWIKELRAKYKVVVNQDVLSKVK